MAVTRINPAAPLPQLRQVVSDFRRLLTDAGPLSSTPTIGPLLDMLDAALAPGAPLPIDVLVQDGTAAADATHWLLGDPACVTQGSAVANGSGIVRNKPVTLNVAGDPRPTPTPGELVPPLLIWLAPDDSSADLERIFDRYALVISTRPLASGSTHSHVVIGRNSEFGALPRALGAPAQGTLLDQLHAGAVAQALEDLTAIAGLAFDQEARSLRAKRALLQQRTLALQARPVPVSASDFMSVLRSRLQRGFADFARGLEERFAGAATVGGSLWSTIDDDVGAIEELEQERKARAIALALSSGQEQRWMSTVRDAVTRHCSADLAALREMLRSAAADIERAVTEAGGPPVVVTFQPLNDDRIERLIRGSAVLQRKYQGELPARGFFEYAAMARRYQMIVYMLLSAFGLTFLRSYREFMIPAAILLLSAGALEVVHSVRRERAESMAAELEKARELLRGETRRIFADVQRSWPQLVSQHLADQLPLVLAQVESGMRESLGRAATEAGDERQRIQRQLQGFETVERKLSLPQKNRELLAQTIAQMHGELRQLVAAAVRGVSL
jgi:hypothetical protein